MKIGVQNLKSPTRKSKKLPNDYQKYRQSRLAGAEPAGRLLRGARNRPSDVPETGLPSGPRGTGSN